MAPSRNSALPRNEFTRRYLNSFRENNYLGLIGLSPPATGHPLIFNISRFGPPVSVANLQPALGWITGFQLRPATNAQLRLGFPSGSYSVNLAANISR